jgi:hypothetical protein
VPDEIRIFTFWESPTYKFMGRTNFGIGKERGDEDFQLRSHRFVNRLILNITASAINENA